MKQPDRKYLAALLEPRERRIVVYAWAQLDKVLYVGHTKNGTYRLINHHVIGKASPLLPSDMLWFWDFNSIKEAKDFEAEAILFYRPKFQTHYHENPKAVYIRHCFECKQPHDGPNDICFPCKAKKLKIK